MTTEKIATSLSVDALRLVNALGLDGKRITKLTFTADAGNIMLLTVEQYITEEQLANLCNEFETNPPKEIK